MEFNKSKHRIWVSSIFLKKLKYILFLRLLSQDQISLNDIEFSRILIDEFQTEFKELYGSKHQTFNLHSLQNLPNQVESYGPNHKCNCFPFEGWFKNVSQIHNGTNNLSGQIANNLNNKLKVHFELKDNLIRKPELKAFVAKVYRFLY